MIEKSLIVIIFCYATGLLVYGGQFYFGDVIGVTLTNVNGVPLKSNIETAIKISTLNTIEQNITNSGTNRTAVIFNPIGQAAGIASELFLLLTGTYIFDFVYLMLGATPAATFTVAPFVAIYVILLARTIIGYIRGI